MVFHIISRGHPLKKLGPGITVGYHEQTAHKKIGEFTICTIDADVLLISKYSTQKGE
jgi:hypothetical protein